MISKELGSSRRFAALGKTENGEFAQCLYQLVVTWSDDFGRSSGDAFTVKHRVFPTNARDETAFESALVQMEGVGLIRRWSVENQHVLEVVGFDDHQNGLHKRTRSKFPDANGETQQPSAPAPTVHANKASSVVSDRVAQLLEHYPSQYLALTGQPYVQSRMQQGKDLEAAEALCRAYDDGALQKIVKTYLLVDEDNPKAKLIRGSQRTLPKLVTMAGSLASLLKLSGAKHE
tara:strand:+ start:921 stop:1616 length:696 start_codon:yes stop_codon:yes gene_type:complete